MDILNENGLFNNALGHLEENPLTDLLMRVFNDSYMSQRNMPDLVVGALAQMGYQHQPLKIDTELCKKLVSLTSNIEEKKKENLQSEQEQLHGLVCAIEIMEDIECYRLIESFKTTESNKQSQMDQTKVSKYILNKVIGNMETVSKKTMDIL